MLRAVLANVQCVLDKQGGAGTRLPVLAKVMFLFSSYEIPSNLHRDLSNLDRIPECGKEKLAAHC